MRRRDQVEQGHALYVLEGIEAEHLQVSLVGTDVHAFVHVRDGVTRGIDQRVATAFGFADLRFEHALGASRLEVSPFGPHARLDVVDAAAQDQPAGMVLQRQQHGRIIGTIDHQKQWQVLAAGGYDLGDLGEGQRFRFAGRQHEVERLAIDRRGQLLLGFRARWPHGDAAVTQSADDALGRLDAVVDDHQPQHAVFVRCHSCLR